jgi:HAD superfamily hydrolase (TIGR01549 family)
LRRNGIEVTWDEYFAQVQVRLRVKPTTAIADAAHCFVHDDALWDKIYHEGRGEYVEMRKPRPYGMLLDNMQAVIRDLRTDFQLGIVANQHPPVIDALRDYGLTPYFDVIAIDEIIGVSKPDPAIFQWALDKAGCTAQEAIAVGDRPDHDIAPARSIGMHTVRLRRGMLYALYDPLSDLERADEVVYDLFRLAPAIRLIATAMADAPAPSLLQLEQARKLAANEDYSNRPAPTEQTRQQREQAEKSRQ